MSLFNNVSKPLLFMSLLLSLSATVWAEDQTATQALDHNSLEDLKKSVLKLNRDLLILEEELLYPASNQIAVFVSVDIGEFFQLDSIKLKIDNQLSNSHLYTEKQLDALYKGGIQRFYIGNLKAGEHKVSAFFTGIGPNGRDYKRAAEFNLTKTSEPALLELKIVDSTAKFQPEFEIKQWPVN